MIQEIKQARFTTAPTMPLNVQPAWYNALDAIDQRFVDGIWNTIYRLHPDASTYLHWRMFLYAIGATL